MNDITCEDIEVLVNQTINKDNKNKNKEERNKISEIQILETKIVEKMLCDIENDYEELSNLCETTDRSLRDVRFRYEDYIEKLEEEVEFLKNNKGDAWIKKEEGSNKTMRYSKMSWATI